jgi:hypothetical protein
MRWQISTAGRAGERCRFFHFVFLVCFVVSTALPAIEKTRKTGLCSGKLRPLA